MARRTILTAAITGNLITPEINPHLPVTPEQIALQALDAAAAGAAILHLHVRDFDTANGSMRLDLYQEVVIRIRTENTEFLINLTTGEGGRFVPSEDDPKVAAAGSSPCAPEKRVAHIEELRPDICTLDFNTMWSGQASVINSPRNLEIMADRIDAAGDKPEIEIFDSGDLHMVQNFVARGVIKARLMVQMVLGGTLAFPDDAREILGLTA